jgi:hypothetical protein
MKVSREIALLRACLRELLGNGGSTMAKLVALRNRTEIRYLLILRALSLLSSKGLIVPESTLPVGRQRW